MIKVEIGNTGQVVEFPDDTTPEVMQKALSQYTATASPIPYEENAGLGEKALGAIEAAGTIATGAIAEPVAGWAGIGAAIIPGGKTGAEAVESAREALTYQPRTEQGKAQVQAVGEFIEPVAKGLEKAEGILGDTAFEETGSPFAAAAAVTIPTVLMELLGVFGLKGGAKAAAKARDIAKSIPDERMSSILAAAKKADVPILTTDLFPPEGFVGRTVQSISEKLGPLGSGTARASQQRARIEAVSGIADNIDIGTPFVDDIVKSLNKKSASTLQNAGRVRDKAVTSLNKFGEFGAERAISKIDSFMGEQQRLGATASEALTKELKGFRSELLKKSDFSLKKDLRTQLIKKIKAFDRAEDTAPGAVLQQVKSALDKDMISFARKNDRVATKEWLSSNRKFADELDKIKRTELKRILQSGDATPEKVIPILKGGKASELKRLHDSLGDKGRASAKGALIQQALKDAKYFAVDANPNPNALATALNRPAFQQAAKVFFKGRDKAELDGFVRMLDTTRRAQSSQAVVKTGEQLLLPGGAAGVGAAVGAGILPGGPTIAAATIASALAKTYESRAFRGLLIKLSNTKKGSKIETRVLESAMPFVVAELQAAKKQQQQKEETGK